MSCDPYSNGLDSFSDGSVWESATGRQLYSVNIGYSRYRYNVKFSPDSKWIVTRGDSTKIWEIETGRLIKAIRGEFGGFHPYLPLILVYGKSGYSLVSLNTGATLLSCDYNDLSDWVVTHPSGLFDASPGAMEKLYFIQDGEKIEFNRLKDKYYEPGLWEKVMSGEPLRVVEN
jgi:WD40 repeat protein